MRCADRKFLVVQLNRHIKEPVAGHARAWGGFTLLELMMTLTIATTLGVLAVPAVVGAIKRDAQRVQANELLGDLVYARSEAIKGGASVNVCSMDTAVDDPTCTTAANPSCTDSWIVFVDANNNGQVDNESGDVTLRIHQPPDRKSQSESREDAAGPENVVNTVQFSGDGRAATGRSSSARFRLCDVRGFEETLAVEVTATGRTKVVSAAPAAAAALTVTHERRPPHAP